MAFLNKTHYIFNDKIVHRSSGIPELGSLIANKGKIFKVQKLSFCRNRVKAHLRKVIPAELEALEAFNKFDAEKLAITVEM